MAIDGILIYSQIKTIKQFLPCKINKIQQISDFEFILNLYNNKSNKLLINLNSTYNHMNFTNDSVKALLQPSSFLMLLRKYIEGSFILDVVQKDFDRVVTFKIQSRNDLGDIIHYDLVIELMGKYSNLILVNNDNIIIDALKRIPPFENTIRTIHPGAKFTFNPKPDSINPFTYTSNDYEDINFDGFSPILKKELIYRMNTQSYESFINELKNSTNLYCYSNKFHIIQLKHLDEKYNIYPINEGLDYYYNDIINKMRIKQQTNDLNKIVKSKIKKINNKITKLKESLLEANDCDLLKKYGDLLFANSYISKDKSSSLEVYDYEDDCMITISLDNKYDIKRNAQLYFKKYNKLKKSILYLNEQLNIANNELLYFENLNSQLVYANIEDALEIKNELIDKKYIKGKLIKKKKDKTPNFHKITYNDYSIIFGKNNIQNEYVTFKKANRYHYFFHVKDYHGTHLVVESDNLNEDIIRFASMIAAYYSQSRDSNSIPIDYCLVKDVKKIPGNNIGLVNINNYKTIFIDIDYDLIDKYI